MLLTKRKLKTTAWFLLGIMTFQLVYPNRALALTSGPSQPEVQGFEPVGTTDMVDLFSGDFVYNIPLLDVEGYPINISYHGGINMDQEASWVGLGWNINPGEINRTVRGIPDDFDGDSVKKVLHIKDEQNVTIGANVNTEPEGVGPPIANLSLSLGGNVNFSNYRGMSVNLTGGVNANILQFVSAGVNLGVGSQTGAEIDYNAGFQFSSSKLITSDMAAGIGVGYNSGYNTRSGLATRSFNVNVSGSAGGAKLVNLGTSIPIGMVNNIVPVITNSSVLRSYHGQVRVGGEAFGLFGAIGVNARLSILHYDEDGSRKTFGYLHTEHSSENDILDFTREKDGMFNQSMKNLPLGSLTYDVYSVSGQGTGGSFRPFRNDFGSVFDPVTDSKTSDKTKNGEVGVGNIFSLGYDQNNGTTTVHSGPWDEYKKPFRGSKQGSIYESVYFKQGGELTTVDPAYFSQIGGFEPLDDQKSVPYQKVNSNTNRDARGNMVSYFNGDEATQYGVASDTALYSYNTNGFDEGYPVTSKKDYIPRIDRSAKLGKKAHHISEIVQVQTNGKRYVYGIPAMNNIQKEVTFSVNRPANDTDRAKGLAPYSGTDDSKDNGNGIDKYYSANYTSSFAHSFLLSSVLSLDYIDVKGDGPTDDDFGSYTKFNYTRKESDYRWRAPIDSGKAQYMPGFITDKKDDKASYLIGSREQWMLHSIETKNFVAEFYTSPRLDGKGVRDAISNSGEGFDEYPYNTALGEKGSSYKLDSIKLFNKHDRFVNLTNAVPVKTIYFNYDYSLCKHIPNRAASAPDSLGKLTLKKIFVKYGNSDKSLLSPYQFNYSSFNPDYNLANKDRWGGFKMNKITFPNSEFPYVDQTSDSLDTYASAWSLQNIQLPSGGVINVDYEADDYAFVQNKEATEMFMLQGVGPSKYYMEANSLFNSNSSPNLYSYFKRRSASEDRSLDFKDRYFKNLEFLYFNFSVRLVSPDFEPIKGYGEIDMDNVGICPNDTNYGYVKVNPVSISGGTVHPATNTSLNVGRYNLSHLIFPGSNPDESDLTNIIYGMWDAIKGLVGFMKSPSIRLMNENKGRYVDLDKSYIRLSTPNGHKVGGGHRVKSMQFYDNWSQLVGGDAQDATYGKSYDYTNGSISSGVASYEPQIGADEIPFKVPIPYKVQNGTNFPPSDPVELYQEMPIGESFYPPASVGYSKVTVSSIHKDVGRSAQGQDIYEYYTARDFPIDVTPSTIKELAKERKYKFKSQKVTLSVSQGYTIILNDMHGKTKRVEHRALLPQNNKYQVISYQDYKYNTSGGRLDNNVPVIIYDGGAYRTSSKILGLEADLTLDTRQKLEHTSNDAFFFSSNGFALGPIPVYIPVPVPWNGEYDNEFSSAVSTKIIQQYGILREVQSFDEGAVTTVRNEAYDPYTGQALITSVNNEFSDREYSLTMPAYWAYENMGPSYKNIGYLEHFDKIYTVIGSSVITGSTFSLPTTSGNFKVGDEVLVTQKTTGGKVFTAWVMDFDTSAMSYSYTKGGPGCGANNCYNVCICPMIQIRNAAPSYISGLTDGVANVDVKVIRSGYKNQLNESIQSVTAMDDPIGPDGKIRSKFTKVINIKAQKFSDSLYARLDRDITIDTLNNYVNGNFGINRSSAEYVYLTNRDYKGSGVRKAGLFDATSFWQYQNTSTERCRIVQTATGVELPADIYPSGAHYDPTLLPMLRGLNLFRDRARAPLVSNPAIDKNWKLARAVTKWTPWGFEAENVDALNNYSAAVYRYNNMQPVAVAQNARQKELLNENFEDFPLLHILLNWVPYEYSPFYGKFGALIPMTGSPYGTVDMASGSSDLEIVDATAHSGWHSLLVKNANSAGASVAYGISVPLVDPALPETTIKMEQAKVFADKEYLFSFWFKPTSVANGTTQYSLPGVDLISSTSISTIKKSNIIDGWQQVEVRFKAPPVSFGSKISIRLPVDAYVDDIRLFPMNANMKSFVYNPFTQKLMATLDENNYATFYEYDQEGNLVRTKRETERGIITLSESRSANPAR